jgi:ATP-dependent DNA helicase PIF1
MAGEDRIFHSTDSIQDRNDEANDTRLFPPEFLNSIDVPGFPPHTLELKVGCPIILLRNIHARKGLCNGTRMIVKSVSKYILEAEITNGTHVGETTYIPRIDLCTEEGLLPFILRRRQFPVKLAFAMTINKSQGQSLTHVGLYLSDPVFAHGQLYVGCGRCGNPRTTSIYINEQKKRQGFILGKYVTRNIVYREVFND